jgi:serine protease AprX
VNTPSQSDDAITSWSTYGVTQDGFFKPELVAPGRHITAPLASTSSGLATQFPAQIVDNSYLTLSGTSMATAVMSGVAALIFQAHPLWTNDQVKWLVTQSSNVQVLGGSHPYLGQGAGEVNAQADVSYFGIPGFANQGLTISGLLVGPYGLTTYLNAVLGLTLSPLSWATSPWANTSWSSSSWSSSSWSSSSWSSSGQP